MNVKYSRSNEVQRHLQANKAELHDDVNSFHNVRPTLLRYWLLKMSRAIGASVMLHYGCV